MMEKIYNPHAIESKWYPHWEKQGYFQPSRTGTPYCIMLPPPNVTGQLHMGHAFQDTLMDALIRYHRMKGCNTLWQVGTDHAGIATQMVVERQLAAENITRQDLGREAFIEKVWAWKETSGNQITQQMRRLGASGDWSRGRFTMDPGLSKAVQTVFIRLYNEGLIYRGERLVNWDPVLQTALSDLEVLSEEEAGALWHIQYPIVGSTETITVATTRPETLLGDAAVAVHPEDPRYQHLIGQMVALPLTDRQIPIIADDFVDIAFGSGSVKITPAHDFNDYEVGRRHNLPMISIFTLKATLNETVPEAYRGLDRFDARKKVIEDLKARHLLLKEESYTIKIPRGDRSQAIVEPLLTQQWYVKAAPLAEPATEAVRSGQIKFVPQHWENTYFAWMDNIQDWCISRQLWWGHRIPAWYDNKGTAYVGENEAAIRQAHQLSPEVSLTQDQDVLDTWFSSALWPFSTLGWPDKTIDLEQYYPTNVLVTGFDIIFFWVARMIMMGLKFTNQIPFKTVYVHGLIQDSEGQKMSKSKGNTLDPLDIIDGISLENLLEKRTQGLMQPHLKNKILAATQKQFKDGISSYGTDALRFTFCALASTGRHIRFDMARVEGYRNFCNKLWNAARYVLMQVEPYQKSLLPADPVTALDRWIWTELQTLKKNIAQHFETYRFDLMAQDFYNFTWNTYCDWYLELSKPLLAYDLSPEKTTSTRYTLVAVLDELLRLMHPIIPFMTEEIWQMLPHAGEGDMENASIMMQPYPLFDEAKEYPAEKEEIEWLQSIVMAIRTIRGEKNIPPNKALSLFLKSSVEKDHLYLEKNAPFLQSLTKCQGFHWLSNEEPPPLCISALAGSLELFIPLLDFMDKEEEIARLEKELEKWAGEIQRAQTKLENTDYVAKAPAVVIEKERQKVATASEALEKIQHQLMDLQKL